MMQAKIAQLNKMRVNGCKGKIHNKKATNCNAIHAQRSCLCRQKWNLYFNNNFDALSP